MIRTDCLVSSLQDMVLIYYISKYGFSFLSSFLSPFLVILWFGNCRTMLNNNFLQGITGRAQISYLWLIILVHSGRFFDVIILISTRSHIRWPVAWPVGKSTLMYARKYVPSIWSSALMRWGIYKARKSCYYNEFIYNGSVYLETSHNLPLNTEKCNEKFLKVVSCDLSKGPWIKRDYYLFMCRPRIEKKLFAETTVSLH